MYTKNVNPIRNQHWRFGGTRTLRIQLSAAIAYCEGYEFHQREVGADPALLDWVLKKDYLE